MDGTGGVNFGGDKMKAWGTKAETLAFLFERQNELGARVLPLVYFSVEDWQRDSKSVLQRVTATLPNVESLIVRSSARNEDNEKSSCAGKYDSVICDNDERKFIAAVNKVIDSYGDSDSQDQVLVQPFLTSADGAGVAFTADPNGGGQYYVISYDLSGSTSVVTGGQSRHHKLFYAFKQNFPQHEGIITDLCQILERLEKILNTETLDVEFAFKDNIVYIFQTRPLVLKTELADINAQENSLRRIEKYVQEANQPKPFLYGERTLYSNMTDWNPAEMIGTHPKPLSLSLYKELITDANWAYQRDNYGYMRLRSFPLMVDFCGLPYIDVRVSFNSFVPANLSPSIAEKLVNYYLRELSAHPNKHDKVEFDIIFSCYTFDLPKRIDILRQCGFTIEEVDEIVDSLRCLTNRIINSKTGLWRTDIGKIRLLQKRYGQIVGGSLNETEKMYWLLEDCKRYGTLPFAGLARAGFIAVQLLQSMVKENIINREEYDSFMREIDTVGSRLRRDFGELTKADFLQRYGHLRPGTYDITSARYDEKPDLYFRWQEKNDVPTEEKTEFRLSLMQLSKIKTALETHGLDDDVLGLFTFIRAAIEGRETAKFVFTKNVSEILRLFGLWGNKHGFSVEDCAYADIGVIREVYGGASDENKLLRRVIMAGKQKHAESCRLILPPLIGSAQDTTAFYMPDGKPTFVTQNRTQGRVVFVERQTETNLTGKILLIPAADPGYDWIFSREIAGFVTEYGGANSHMAIRAGELGIPAVIGAGTKLFGELKNSQIIEIDASLGKVTVLG